MNLALRFSVVVAFCIGAMSVQAADTAWKPRKAVEIVVGAQAAVFSNPDMSLNEGVCESLLRRRAAGFC